MEHNYDDFDYTGESGEAFDSKEIGKRIRLARKMRHISQIKLAEMLDRSLRTIQKYECGYITVSGKCPVQYFKKKFYGLQIGGDSI